MSRLTAIWLLLMGATILSWLLGHGDFGDARLVSATVIVIAFIKVRFVGLDFMELRNAPRGLRAAFETWLVVVAGALTLLATQ